MMPETITIGLPAPPTGMDFDPSVSIVFANAAETEDLAAFASSPDAPKRWLLVRIAGQKAWIGPYVTDSSRPCAVCLTEWLKLRRQPPNHTRPNWADVIPNVEAASRRAGWYTGRVTEPSGEVHAVLPRPQCRMCGEPTAVFPKQFPRIFPSTREKRIDLERFVNPVTGIVEQVNEYTTGRFTAAAAKVHAPGRIELSGFGSGDSPAQARTAATAEALERYSMVLQGYEPYVRAEFAEVENHAVHPDLLTQFSERQYARRSEWNAGEWQFPWIPPKYSGGRTEWAFGWSLSAAQTRLLPLSFCYMGDPPSGARFWLAADSVGCAAGPSPRAAIERGVLELVERDAVAIWWANRIPRPAIPNEAWKRDATLSGALDALRSLEREYVALDLTTDLGIPVVGCLSWDSRGGSLDFGFGASTDPRAALRRAFHELAQTAVGNHAERGMRLEPGSAEAAYMKWRKSARRHNEPHLTGAAENDRWLQQKSSTSGLPALIGRLKTAGIETIALDLTRPEVGLPVFRVICPGLRHPSMRLAPGRLYDVPVQMGWATRALEEEETNPVPFCL